MDKKHFDFIICGGGASGLLLANSMVNDSFFAEKSILIIEKDQKQHNDRTWCFWEKEGNPFENIVDYRWNSAQFKSKDTDLNFSLLPMQYKMIRSKVFYEQIHHALEAAPQVKTVQATVTSITSEKNHSKVATEQGMFEGAIVFSSILNDRQYLNHKRYPLVKQHFIGWFVKTEKPCFDKDSFKFMDFDIPQYGETRFIYVLPFSPTEALVEYTLFSKNLLKSEEYEEGIDAYLKKIDSGEYSILEKEQGSIPMSCYPFYKQNTNTLFHIGTAGGWTKASTGFTFKNSQKKTAELIAHLKANKPLKAFEKKTRFWYYDLLFLDVLYKYNFLGSRLFSRMFQKLTPQLVFKFLDEKTSPLEELKILSSFPAHYFIKALFKRLI